MPDINVNCDYSFRVISILEYIESVCSLYAARDISIIFEWINCKQVGCGYYNTARSMLIMFVSIACSIDC